MRFEPQVGVPWVEVRLSDCVCSLDDVQPVWLCAGEAGHAIPGHHSAVEGQLHTADCRLPCQRYAPGSATLIASLTHVSDACNQEDHCVWITHRLGAITDR